VVSLELSFPEIGLQLVCRKTDHRVAVFGGRTVSLNPGVLEGLCSCWSCPDETWSHMKNCLQYVHILTDSV